MRNKIKTKAKEIASNPNTKKVLLSMKPERNFWGISGVVLFLIFPEIIAYIWGADITLYANRELLVAESFLDKQYFEMLIMLFEDGMSYINLLIGIVLFIWLFF